MQKPLSDSGAAHHAGLTRHYIAALLLLALFATVAYFCSMGISWRQKVDARRIKVANQQRLFCEELNESLDALSTAPDNSQRDIVLGKIDSYQSLFNDFHHILLEGRSDLRITAINHDSITTRFTQIKPYFDGINSSLAALRQQHAVLLQDSAHAFWDQRIMHDFQINQAGYLDGMNDIIAFYNDQAAQRIIWMERAALALLFLILIVLVLEGLYIFRPISRRIQQEMRAKMAALQQMREEMAERKRIGIQLERSEERYRHIFDGGLDMVFVLSLRRGKLVDANRITIEKLGFAEEELFGSMAADIFGPAFIKKLQKWKKNEESQGNFLLETTLYSRESRPIEVEIHAHLLTLQDELSVLGIARDISERKAIERTVREQEDRYVKLFQHSNDGILVHDLNGQIIDANEKVLELLGYQQQEITDLYIADIYADDIEVDVRTAFLKIRRNGFVNFEIPLLRKGGESFPAEISSSIFEVGGRQLVQGIIRDISRRKENEEINKALYRIAETTGAVQDMEAFYSAIHSAVNDLIASECFYISIFDPRDQSLTLSYSSFPEDQYDSDEVFLPKLTEQLIKNRQPMLLRKSDVHQMAVEGIIPFPKREPDQWLGAPLKTDGHCFGAIVLQSFQSDVVFRDGDEQILGFLAHNIAYALERRQSVEIIKNERKWLNVTLGAIGEGVITTDTNGKVLWLNGRAEELTGHPVEKAAGKKIEAILKVQLQNKATTTELINKVVASGQPVEFTQAWLPSLAAGNDRTIRLQAIPIADEEGESIGVALVFKDITTELAIEQELQRAQRLESLGFLAGGIAHDFNNLLTAITGNISLALETADDTPKVIRRLGDAENACRRARGLTQQLLTFSKGGAPIRKTTSVAELVKESVGFILHGSSVRVRFDMDDDLWMIRADEDQVSQVVSNLVINAKQAMTEGGEMTISCRNRKIDTPLPVVNGTIAAGNYISIAIRDTGMGIPVHNLPRIFDLYYTTKVGGSGLGLATCYQIITRHEGFMDVQSKVGEGTCFTIYLPAQPEAKPQQLPESEEAQGGTGRVLVMDDEEAIRSVMMQMLNSLGYQSDAAIDGRQVVEKYRKSMGGKNKFDVVIMDLTVPGGVGGLEALTELKKIDPNIRAVVSSGYSHDPVLANYRKYGFLACVRKPFNISEIGRVLTEALDEEMAVKDS